MREGRDHGRFGGGGGRGSRLGDTPALRDRPRQRTHPPLPEKPGADCYREEENDDGEYHGSLFRSPLVR